MNAGKTARVKIFCTGSGLSEEFKPAVPLSGPSLPGEMDHSPPCPTPPQSKDMVLCSRICWLSAAWRRHQSRTLQSSSREGLSPKGKWRQLRLEMHSQWQRVQNAVSKVSIRQGSWFSKSKLSVETMLKLTYCWDYKVPQVCTPRIATGRTPTCWLKQLSPPGRPV